MRWAIALALLGVLASTTSAALAQSADTVHAKEAYDRGVAAHAKGDYARAAREFAAADSFAPSSVALQAALEEAVDANDPITGAELLERSKRVQPPVPERLNKSIETARKKLGGRAGRVRVSCPPGSTCTGTLDGRTFDPRTPTWALAGARTMILSIDGETETRTVDVKADDTTDVTIASKKKTSPLPPAAPPEVRPPPPPPPAPRPAPERSGLSPVVFIIGAGATAVAGGVTGALMVRAKSKHDDFTAGGCDAAPNAGCTALSSDGTEAQRNANIGIVVTAVLGVATIAVGAFFTDWGGGESTKSAFTANGYLLRF